MNTSFAKQSHYRSLVVVFLAIAAITALILATNELLMLQLDRRFVVLAALITLAVSIFALLWQSYRLYQQVRQFLPQLFNSNILSENTRFVIADEFGNVWLNDDMTTIGFCNKNLAKSWSNILHNTHPTELVFESDMVRICKLSDFCNPGQDFQGVLLITITSIAKKSGDLNELIHSLQVPAYIEDAAGKIMESNSLYNELEQPQDFHKIKVFDDKNVRCFILTTCLDRSQDNDLQSLSAHHPIAAITIDKKTNILNKNGAFCKLMGFECGLNLSQFSTYLDEDSKKNLLSYVKDNERAETTSCEIRFSAHKSLICMLYITYTPENENFFCNIINITEYKNIEMNFIHSQKMQAIGQLAGGIAHDFNNLLTAMLGFCDLLLIRHPAGDPSFADIMQIQQNGKRAANLVKQLLATSRKQVLRPRVLDITNTLAELANLIRRLIGENIELRMNYGRDLMQVVADHGQLDQVIMNLAVNARDAIGTNGILTINTSNVMITDNQLVDSDLISAIDNESIAPGKYVLIEVIDTGSGIPKEELDKIFEPFYSTKEVGSGTGLGLATVYGIIRQTGGYLYVSSKVGSGTRFCIYLKVASEKEIVAASISNEDDSDGDSDTKLIQPDLTGNSTILLVEDEIPVRMFSARTLANKGYDVIEAGSGEEALTIMDNRGEDIDLIVTDVIMPGINGPTLIAQIKKTRPNIKVIFMSGYAKEAFSNSYEIDGDFYFLAKPFTLKQLALKVKEVLS